MKANVSQRDFDLMMAAGAAEQELPDGPVSERIRAHAIAVATANGVRIEDMSGLARSEGPRWSAIVERNCGQFFR